MIDDKNDFASAVALRLISDIIMFKGKGVERQWEDGKDGVVEIRCTACRNCTPPNIHVCDFLVFCPC